MSKKYLTHINGIEIFRRKIEILPKNKDLVLRARALRKAYVLSEVIFWKQVRNGTFHGIDFDRQRIIGDYIVDFYVKSLGLVIEINDSSHNDKEEFDEKKDDFLKSLDLKIVRISDIRVKHDGENVMKELEDYIIEHFSTPD